MHPKRARVSLGREFRGAEVKILGQSTGGGSRRSIEFPSLQLNANQCLQVRKLPKGGKEPPGKNGWYNLEVQTGIRIVLVSNSQSRKIS